MVFAEFLWPGAMENQKRTVAARKKRTKIPGQPGIPLMKKPFLWAGRLSLQGLKKT
jgi:hypothetical protein